MQGTRSVAAAGSTGTWPVVYVCVVVSGRDHFRFPHGGFFGQCCQNACQNPHSDFMVKNPDAIDSSGECGLAADLRLRPETLSEPEGEESVNRLAIGAQRPADSVDLDATLAELQRNRLPSIVDQRREVRPIARAMHDAT